MRSLGGSSRCLAMVATPSAVLGPDGVEGWASWLAPYEQERASAFRIASARAAYVAAHVLVRMVAAKWLRAEAGGLVLSQRCGECGGAHGEPRIDAYPMLRLSMSHCEGAVAVAAADVPVGIDVEASRNGAHLLSEGIPAYSANELARIRGLSHLDRETFALTTWVRKESLIKLGRLTLDTLSACDLVDQPPQDLVFTDFSHVTSQCTGTVTSSCPAQLEFLN